MGSERIVIALFAISIIVAFCDLSLNNSERVMPMIKKFFLSFCMVIESVNASMMANLLMPLEY